MEKVPADQRLRSRVLDQHLRDAIYSFIADCGNNMGNPNRPPGEAVADSELKSRPLGLGRTGAVVGETGAVAARQGSPSPVCLRTGRSYGTPTRIPFSDKRLREFGLPLFSGSSRVGYAPL